MTDLRVLVGERNGDHRRHLTYRYGEQEYPDVVDINSGFQREQSVRKALELFGLPAENLPALVAEVVKLAKEKDASGFTSNIGKPRLVTMNTVQPEPITWLWPGAWPLAS